MATKEKTEETEKDFEEYRKKMHPEEDEGTRRSVIPTPHSAVRMAMGIFMILLYVGMGVLLFINFFNWDTNFTWVRWLVGSVLVLYGIFRAYRQFSGRDYYSK